jgi:hypothetical protein
MYQKPKMGVYIDNNGRQWQTNEVEIEVEHAKDENGNVIPLLNEDGRPTGARSRDRDAAVLTQHRFQKWQTTYATSDDVGSQRRGPLSSVSSRTSMTTSSQSGIASTPSRSLRSRTIQQQRPSLRVWKHINTSPCALPAPDVIDAESSEIVQEVETKQESNAELQAKSPRGVLRSHDGTGSRKRA